jgi:hypothetical protein
MKDFRGYVRATNGQVWEFRGRMKEWEDLTKWEQDDLVKLFAKVLVDDYLHPPPFCRVCLRDNCPALKNEGECPAERPLRWLPGDRPRTRRRSRRQKATQPRDALDLQRFLNRL